MAGILASLGSFMGIGGASAGAGLSSTKSSSVGTMSSTATQEGKSTAEATGTSTAVQTSMDEASKRILDSLTQQLSGIVGTKADTYSKASAISDAQGIVEGMFKQYREQDLPNIVATMGASGAYNSTGAQTLANSAFADTIAKAATAVTQNIANYAGIERENEQMFMTGLLQSLGLQQEATKSTTQQESGTSSSTSNIKETANSTSTNNSKSKSKSFSLKLF